MKTYATYILANKPYGTLYIGVTSDLAQSMYQHKNKLFPGFTCHYNVNRLVYYEHHGLVQQAIAREKQLKHWNRAWKIALIEKANRHWVDLYPALLASI